jgi:chromosome segregation ATPase
LSDDIEQLKSDAEAASTRHRELAEESERAQAALRAASEAVGIARSKIDDARVAISLAGEPLTAEALADAEREAARFERAASDLKAEHDQLEREIADLEVGRPPRPPEIDAFRALLLNEHQIVAELVAERLEAPQPTVAEAVLGEHVWTLVVPAAQFEAAVTLAGEHGYRLPLAAAGNDAGRTGALRNTSGFPEATAFLAEVDLPVGEVPGVSLGGVVRGRTWAWLRTRAQPVLGAAAREQAITARQERLAAIAAELQPLAEQAGASREAATRKRTGLEAAARLVELEGALAQAEAKAAEADEAASAVTKQLVHYASEDSRINTTLAARKETSEELQSSEGNLERNRLGQETRLAELERRLDEIVLPAGHEGVAVESVTVLKHDLARLAEELADERRFPEEVRSELVLVHRDNQQRTVSEVEMLVEGRRKDLEAVEREVERAKERYERHIREVVSLLGRRFRAVCDRAQMEGEIEIVPAEVEGEFGIDVKVAHVPGEPRRSYRNKAHSTGQKAKISILLLLAAMGLEGAADLLIMDEHSAHLDSRNIDDVAAAMKALSSRVQFILAIPTNEEAKRLQWADHQLAFYPRVAGEPFAPPVVLMTRLPEDERRYLEIGQLGTEE